MVSESWEAGSASTQAADAKEMRTAPQEIEQLAAHPQRDDFAGFAV